MTLPLLRGEAALALVLTVTLFAMIATMLGGFLLWALPGLVLGIIIAGLLGLIMLAVITA